MAVDSVSSALMGMDPEGIATIRLGHQAGLGEMNLARIDIRGDDIKGLTMHYALPSRWLERTFPGLTITGSDRACSGCIVPLFSSLRQLAQESREFKHPLIIALGTAPVTGDSGAVLTIGECTARNAETEYRVGGCPPSGDDIARELSEHTEHSG